jgi:hypothetical protein
MEMIYLVIFEQGRDVHIMNECPSQSNLDMEGIVYIRITKEPFLIEQYSNMTSNWKEVNP